MTGRSDNAAMPELPEVEVTRLSLSHRIEGARVQAARLGKPLRWPLGVDPAGLVGRVVGPLVRRGKYLWMPLGPGSAQGVAPQLGGVAAAPGHGRARCGSRRRCPRPVRTTISSWKPTAARCA